MFAALIQVCSMSESFAELFEESLKTVDMEPGSIVTGVVIDIDNEWVTVHAGLKSEGVIPRDQFTNASGECTLNIGDEVQRHRLKYQPKLGSYQEKNHDQ